MSAMPAPENPNVLANPTDAQLRGAQVFQASGCGSCHMGQWLNAPFERDVGTLVTSGVDPDNGLVMTNPGFNVPSLRGLARSAPYLHDGSAPTIEARLANNRGDLHGTTSNLTQQQMSDLVAYLKSL
jgi:cytochrome c peroxidase